MALPPIWRFREMKRDEPGIDPVHGEFFTTEELEDLNGALVREAVQNSLDARAGDDPVEVVFTFGCLTERKDALNQDAMFRKLGEHIQARGNGLRRVPQAVESLDFVAVEDFGTFGLKGDPSIYEDSLEDMTDQHFYYFWRNIGRSQKDRLRLGRWGLGKQVFPASSRINGFFGLTRREDDGKTFLMGQSVLKVHFLENGRRHFPYGWYGVFPGSDAFAMPVENSADIEAFAETFSLCRRDEPGLSLVVPYPQAEIDNRAVVKAAIVHYFHPILSGDLAVRVRFRDTETVLRTDTIRDAIEQHYPDRSENLVGMIDFSEWAIGLADSDYEVLPDPQMDLTPNWNNITVPEDQQKRIRARFDQEGRVALRVPVRVQRRGATPVMSRFNLYLKREEGLQTGEARFIREGISITHANPHLDRGLRGLVVVHDADLVSLLGDAEPPAHDSWNQQSRSLRDNYEKGSSTVGFVKKSLQNVYRRIILSAADKDVDLLRDLFYVDRTILDQPDRKDTPGKKKGKKEDDSEVEPVSSRPPLIRVQKLDQEVKGFRILPASEDTPVSITVKVAYVVRRGSPLKNYHPYDFQLGKGSLKPETRNVTVTKCEGNVLEADVDAHDFEISVTGFDENRDLFVKAVPLRAANDSED